MNITDVRVRLVNDANDKFKAVASITIDGEFVVHDIKVINGKDGYFLSMPWRKTSDGERKDIAHPTKTEVREMLKEKILAEYEKALANANSENE
ncbi:MAG: septation regulator SpoVG [Candidatus Caccovivens sp.]